MTKQRLFLELFANLKLGVFLRKLGKKDTFWHWEYNRITAIKSAKNKPWVGIPNLVYGCIFGWWYVLYQFWVTVTLTSDQVFRIIVSEAYFLHYLSSQSQILCVVASWDGRMSCTSFRVTVTLTFFLELSYPEYISYIIWGRNPKFGVWMHFWIQIYCGPFLSLCDLDLWPSF